jgi:hypothetical protein
MEKCLKLFFSFYDNIKPCVESGHTFSDFFTCDIVVRHGENLSPCLFAIYLNDLEEFLSEHCKTGSFHILP